MDNTIKANVRYILHRVVIKGSCYDPHTYQVFNHRGVYKVDLCFINKHWVRETPFMYHFIICSKNSS